MFILKVATFIILFLKIYCRNPVRDQDLDSVRVLVPDFDPDRDHDRNLDFEPDTDLDLIPYID